jgi:hypothetical protein
MARKAAKPKGVEFLFNFSISRPAGKRHPNGSCSLAAFFSAVQVRTGKFQA